jgi:hypothetical protein
MKPTKLLILFLFLSLKGFSQTTITSNIIIDQNWITAHPTGPWEITTSSVTVTFGQNLTISDPNQYFIIKAENVTIDGVNKIVTLNGISNYPGLIRVRYGGMEGFSSDNALIKNIGVVNNGSTLANFGGYISGSHNRAEIRNCYSTGPISAVESGGIAGVYNEGDISNCYSTGAISGDKSGGITVYSMNAIISNCYSTGEISGSSSGGIVGMQNYSDIENCYSSGIISGTFFVDTNDTWAVAGGIAPSTPFNTITNYYIGNGTWNSINANAALITGLGSVWNTSVSPYALLSFVPAAPTFANSGIITLCLNGSYYLAPSTTSGTFSSLDPTIATVNSSGYVTAGAITGTTIVSFLLDGGSATVSATVNVVASSSLNITDPLAQPSYKFNNNPQGPIGGINNYVGYNGYNYSGQARPISPGFYRASNQLGDAAGCPYEFNIFRCTTCEAVPVNAKHFVGESYGGGIVFYVTPDGLHGLIAAPSDEVSQLDRPGAITACNNKIIDVYTDWYLPSLYELDLMYNAKSTIGGFTTIAYTYYWSSTVEGEYDFRGRSFFNNQEPSFFEETTNYVRAVRAF